MTNKAIYSLHNKAIEFADEGLLAQKRGENAVAQSFFQKAFLLEKEAALATVFNKENQLFYSILYRSAATLALDCGNIWEAEFLVNAALSKKVSKIIQEQLTDLKQKIAAKKNDFINQSTVELIGIIIGADTPNSEIKLLDSKDNLSYKIFVPQNQLHQIVQSFWAKQVLISGKKDKRGIVFLEQIKQVA